MTDLGVVDPIRAPSWAQGAVDRTPPLARLFIGLTIVDLVARSLGVLEPRAFFGDGVALFATLIPHDAWILLPAIVLIRRPTAGADTPWLLRGTMFIALFTLLERPTFSALGDLLAPDLGAGQILLAVVQALIGAWAYVVLARGLGALNPPSPTPVAEGLANLAGGAIVVAAALNFLGFLVADANTNELDVRLPLAGPFFGMLAELAVAYLVRTVVRGLDDPNRPERATRLGTSGGVLWALGLLVTGVVSALASLNLSFAEALPLWVSLSLILIVDLGALLLVAAFGLGLADPLRPLARDWEAVQA